MNLVNLLASVIIFILLSPMCAVPFVAQLQTRKNNLLNHHKTKKIKKDKEEREGGRKGGGERRGRERGGVATVAKGFHVTCWRQSPPVPL